ncbi:3585_t:CDS:1, partial [Acaulospora colombiana]
MTRSMEINVPSSAPIELITNSIKKLTEDRKIKLKPDFQDPQLDLTNSSAGSSATHILGSTRSTPSSSPMRKNSTPRRSKKVNNRLVVNSSQGVSTASMPSGALNVHTNDEEVGTSLSPARSASHMRAPKIALKRKRDDL